MFTPQAVVRLNVPEYPKEAFADAGFGALHLLYTAFSRLLHTSLTPAWACLQLCCQASRT